MASVGLIPDEAEENSPGVWANLQMSLEEILKWIKEQKEINYGKSPRNH